MKRILLFLSLISLPFSMISNVKAASYASDTLKGKVVTTGDGLYLDKYNEGRYVYKGGNPNNFIKFNNELWRIISVEKDGTLKIIKNDSLDNELQFNTNNKNGSYCSFSGGLHSYSIGCNAWGKSEYFDGGNWYYLTAPYHVFGTVTDDSVLNKFLNNDYYLNLNDNSRCEIVSKNYYFGPLHNDSNDVPSTIEEEKQQVWNGNIGLPNISDMLLANMDENKCGSVKKIFDNSIISYIDKNGNVLDSCRQYNGAPIEGCKTYYKNNCSIDNYLMINGESTSDDYNYLFINAGYVGTVFANSYQGLSHNNVTVKGKNVKPVLYLRSDIQIVSGNGNDNSPYEIICEECREANNENSKNESDQVVDVPSTSMFISVFIIGGFILIAALCIVIYLKVFKKKDINK